ncbi:MAG TPA: pyridoxal-phosphate dependent enzyme [Streptosporangiaceae bacterium]|jgi:threonine dehydratase|nr:pyridoxal-phosphate dependent enzyme [Streptosporangiaceae bacterium]
MSELSALAQQVAAATRNVSETVHRHVTVTPLTSFRAADHGAEVLLKCEHQQKTGSFKVRGALAKLSSLSMKERHGGVITASTGNHGAGFAYALGALGGTGIVCVPEGASPVKVALGQGPAETEKLARDLADRDQLPYISPYNDLYVVAGQGTVG